jgi:hypothetical protein
MTENTMDHHRNRWIKGNPEEEISFNPEILAQELKIAVGEITGNLNDADRTRLIEAISKEKTRDLRLYAVKLNAMETAGKTNDGFAKSDQEWLRGQVRLEIYNRDAKKAPLPVGGTPYSAAHTEPTPIAAATAKFFPKKEAQIADGSPQRLKASHAVFKGGNLSSVDDYDLMHHTGKPPHYVHKSQVVKCLDQLRQSDSKLYGEAMHKALSSSSSGAFGGVTEGEHPVFSKAVAHLQQHLAEINGQGAGAQTEQDEDLASTLTKIEL